MNVCEWLNKTCWIKHSAKCTIYSERQTTEIVFNIKFSLISPFFPSWDISVTNADNAQWLFATCAFKAVCHLIHCKQYNYMKD